MNELHLFKELIEQKKYYKAHESLEKKWQKLKKENSPLQYAYKGLINAAVSFELKKRGRPKHTYEKVWSNFEKYSSFYPLEKDTETAAVFLRKHKKNLTKKSG
ncbi:DUF309 domain-containing protein [Nautilia sp.]